jgi:long-chain fatty acid transport protein
MSRRRIIYSFLIVVFVLFLSTSAFGAGFALYEGSARGNVIGGGLVGSADDASALFYNPAGITQLKGIQTQIGATAITPMITVDTTVPAGPAGLGVPAGSYSNDFERNWYFPPHAYMTHQINNKWYTGIGVFSRYGLGTEFDGGWPGRFNSYRAMIREVEINPNVAYKVNDKFSLAAGVTASYMNLNLSKKLPPNAIGPTPETDFNLAGDSWGYGFNVAAQYKPAEWVQLGISYRSKIDQEVKGTATMNPSGALYPTTSAQGGISLPDTLFAGINFNVTKTLSVGGGVYWTGWEKYDKLQIYFTRPVAGATSSTSFKNWSNVARYLIGTEWKATENWDFRLGYAYDTAPEPDATSDYILPDNDRHMFSIGAGYHRAAWNLDLSYTYMMIADRSYIGYVPGGGPLGTFPGKATDGSAHLIGLTFGYKF